jgi:protein-tyrosine phosphatase
LSSKYEADSCGTASYHIGDQPDSRSRANALENGLEYSHIGRQIHYTDYDEFDLIVPMDASNLANLRNFRPDGKAEIKLMRSFDIGFEDTDVPDPYYGGPKGFQNVFDILDRSTGNLLDQLEKK